MSTLKVLGPNDNFIKAGSINSEKQILTYIMLIHVIVCVFISVCIHATECVELPPEIYIAFCFLEMLSCCLGGCNLQSGRTYDTPT